MQLKIEIVDLDRKPLPSLTAIPCKVKSLFSQQPTISSVAENDFSEMYLLALFDCGAIPANAAIVSEAGTSAIYEPARCSIQKKHLFKPFRFRLSFYQGP